MYILTIHILQTPTLSFLVLSCLPLPLSRPPHHTSPPLPSYSSHPSPSLPTPPFLCPTFPLLFPFLLFSSPSSSLPSPPTPLFSFPLYSTHLSSSYLLSVPFLFSLQRFFSNFSKIFFYCTCTCTQLRLLSIPEYSLLVITMVSRLSHTLYTCVLTNLSLNGG